MAIGSYQNIHQHLIDGCKRGESRAQFDIYQLYYKAMYNTCLRLVGNETEAEDLMQESFFKAFDKISSYRNEVSFGAWLKRIVVNSSLDFLKKNKLNLIPVDRAYDLSEDESVEGDMFPDSVEQVKLAITQLPDGYKVIVNLIIIEGYSHDEVANMLGITASTSRSQLVRAKRKLIEMLNELKNKK
jgi:RNA polymerase sigma-70 factor (ECF subfamily)